MHHNHQSHTYPADKLVPKAVMKRKTGAGKKTAKKEHKRRARHYQKRVANETESRV